MKRSHGYFLVISISIALVAGAAVAAPQWCREVGLDFWNVPEVQREICDEVDLSDHLSVQTEELSRRREMKDRLAEDLYLGQVNLALAAGWFRALNVHNGPGLSVLRHTYPGLTDDELWCRNVIEYTRAYIENRVDSADVVARLEGQLHSMRSRPGGVMLPEVHYDERPAE